MSSYVDPKTTGVLEPNQSLQNITTSSYKAAFLRVTGIIATCIGADQFLTKTVYGKKFWPSYQHFKLDNRLYTLVIIGLCATQYNIKDNEMTGLTQHNTNLLDQQSKEEYEYVKKLEAKKAAALVASSTPVTPGTTISTTTTQLPAKQEH